MISSIKKIEIKPNYWVFGRYYFTKLIIFKYIIILIFKIKYYRIYKWGVCNIEDPEHSDFNLLYSVLIGHLSMDLIE